MPQNITAEFATAVTQPSIKLSILLQIQFITGTVYLWSGIGPLVWNSHTWVGCGTLLQFAGKEDGSTVEAKGSSIRLSGFDPVMLNNVLNNFEFKHIPCVIYLALFDDTNTLVPDPAVLWAGFMDQPSIDVSGTTATIDVALENRLLELNTACPRYYTQEDQNVRIKEMLAAGLLDPNPLDPDNTDNGFLFINQLQEKFLQWGDPTNAPIQGDRM